MYAENLKTVRKELRYTLDAMAEKLGVKVRTYVSWEREGKMPPVELGTRLYDNLNVNLNWFCTGKGNMFNEEQHPQTPEDLMRKEFVKLMKEFKLID